MEKYSFVGFIKKLGLKDRSLHVFVAGFVIGRIVEITIGKFNLHNTLNAMILFTLAILANYYLRYINWLKTQLVEVNQINNTNNQ